MRRCGYFAAAPPEDTLPDAFTFVDKTGASFNTLYTSNAVTITGINFPVTASVTNGQISINGGPWVTSGEVYNNQTIQARGTSAGAYSTAVNVTVTVSSLSDIYTITTKSKPIVVNYVNFDNTNSPERIQVSGNTITTPGATSGYACCVANPIPRDGNWWYYEASFVSGDSTKCYIAAAYQNASQVAAGTVLYTPNPGAVTSYNGMAICYYSALYYVMYLSGGNMSSWSTFSNLEAMYPAIAITGGAGNSMAIQLPNVEHLHAPDVGSFNIPTALQGRPTYSLITI